METIDAPVPCGVLDIAIEAARAAGAELAARFGHPHGHDRTAPERAAAAAAADVLAGRRPGDAVRMRLGGDRAGTGGLRWLVEPLDGAANHHAGVPLYAVSVACEDASGTLAGVVHDPVRDHVFAAVRGGAVRIDGAPAPGSPPATPADLVLAGAIACDSEEEARRAGKLHKRLVRRAGGRRALGSAALELAWTAAGRFGACFHEQHLDAPAVDAGLFLCQRAGLRVHRLPPLEDGLAPRFLAAREPLAAELLELIGPGPKERRRAAQRAPLSAGSVADAMRRRRR